MQLIQSLKEDELVETIELQFTRENKTKISSKKQLELKYDEIDHFFSMGKYDRTLELLSQGWVVVLYDVRHITFCPLHDYQC